MSSDRTANERAGWARWRRKHGKTSINTYPDQDIVEDAIWAGLIPPEKVNDKHFIAKIFGRLLESAVESHGVTNSD